MIDYIIIAVIALAMIAIIINAVRKKKKCESSGCCSGCSASAQCRNAEISSNQKF